MPEGRPLWTWNKGPLSVEAWPIAALSGPDIDVMYGLYGGVAEIDRSSFAASVGAKTLAVLVHERYTRDLVGLMVLKAALEPFPGRGPVVVLSNHHNVYDPRYRGLDVFQGVGLRVLGRLLLRYPGRPVYGLFDALSYKSYLAMTRTFVQCWPRPGHPIPPAERAFVDSLFRRDLPQAWDSEAGVLRWGDRRLRSGVADEPRADEDPDIRFYREVNPGYARGDCLACVMPLTLSNVLRSSWQRWVRRPLGLPMRR